MKLKLPPKLIPPYSYAEWLDLEYNNDPKFTKTLKLLNLSLINLKRTKPPTAEAFGEFTEHTAYLIKRLKKMLPAPDMPGPVHEFCEPFLKLLIKWQKGAVKVQDLLVEEDEESAAQAQAVDRTLAQAEAVSDACVRQFSTLGQSLDKALKDVAIVEKLVSKGAADPKLDAIIAQMRAGKTLKPLAAMRQQCVNAAKKLPDARNLRDLASQAGNDAKLLARIKTMDARLQAIGKLARATDEGFSRYENTIANILKTHRGN